MPEISNTGEQKIEFEVMMKEMSDEQLKAVLKKRIHYQAEAAGAALKEALRRGIIHSEEDLYAPELKPEPIKRKLFPVIEREKNRKKIRRSVARSLLIAGILPAIFGVVKINAGFFWEGLAFEVFGLIWMGIAFTLMRKYSVLSVRSLLVLTGLSIVYVLSMFIGAKQIVFMDGFIVTIVYLLVLYSLLFILRLKG